MTVSFSTWILILAKCYFPLFHLHPLWIFYVARCIHFTVPWGRIGALFFLWQQMYTSVSTFIRKTKPFSVIRQIASSLVLLLSTFDSYWWIGPTPSITSTNVYTKRINSATQTRNSNNTLRFQYLWDFNKCLQAIFSQLSFENFWLFLLVARLFWLKIIKNYDKSHLEVCEL